MKVVVLAGQSLMDIAIQVYGSVEGVFMLAQENGISVTDDLEPGQTLVYSPHNVIRKNIVQYYDVMGLKPATNDIAEHGIFDEIFDLTFN